MMSINEFPAINFFCDAAGMADRNDRNPRNVPGRYYNDNSCIDCDLCRGIAPEIFTRDDDEGLTYVHRQPVTATEMARAEEAMASCPTETIGNDG
jgi:ferredoxin